MEIKQRFVVNYPRAVVWAFFGKMEDVVPCMPGAALTEPPSGNVAKFQFGVKLGPISATFVGESTLERDDANFRGVMRGTGRDNRGDSRVKSVVEHVLTEEDGGSRTAVDISVDFTLTGRLAQFSRGGIVNDLASRLTAEFARNLESALAAQAPAPVPAAAPSAATPGAVAPPPGASGAAAGTAAAAGAGATATAAPAPAAPPRAPAAPLDAGNLIFAVLWARVKAFFRGLVGR